MSTKSYRMDRHDDALLLRLRVSPLSFANTDMQETRFRGMLLHGLVAREMRVYRLSTREKEMRWAYWVTDDGKAYCDKLAAKKATISELLEKVVP